MYVCAPRCGLPPSGLVQATSLGRALPEDVTSPCSPSLPLNIPTALGGEAGKRDASILLQVSWMHLSSSAFFGQKMITAIGRLLGQENHLGKACMHSDSDTSPLLSSHLRPKGRMSILFCLKDPATASGPSAASVLWSERRRRPTCPESKLATLDI